MKYMKGKGKQPIFKPKSVVQCTECGKIGYVGPECRTAAHLREGYKLWVAQLYTPHDNKDNTSIPGSSENNPTPNKSIDINIVEKELEAYLA